MCVTCGGSFPIFSELFSGIGGNGLSWRCFLGGTGGEAGGDVSCIEAIIDLTSAASCRRACLAASLGPVNRRLGSHLSHCSRLPKSKLLLCFWLIMICSRDRRSVGVVNSGSAGDDSIFSSCRPFSDTTLFSVSEVSTLSSNRSFMDPTSFTVGKISMFSVFGPFELARLNGIGRRSLSTVVVL